VVEEVREDEDDEEDDEEDDGEEEVYEETVTTYTITETTVVVPAKLTGWIKKKGQVRNNWKKRFAVLVRPVDRRTSYVLRGFYRTYFHHFFLFLSLTYHS
jgi:hypothetical protein